MPLPTLSRAACNQSYASFKHEKFLVEKLENHICLDYKSLQLCVVPISRNLIRHIICSLSISLFFKIEKRIKIYTLLCQTISVCVSTQKHLLPRSFPSSSYQHWISAAGNIRNQTGEKSLLCLSFFRQNIPKLNK